MKETARYVTMVLLTAGCASQCPMGLARQQWGQRRCGLFRIFRRDGQAGRRRCLEIWRPQRESNPCLQDENLVS